MMGTEAVGSTEMKKVLSFAEAVALNMDVFPKLLKECSACHPNIWVAAVILDIGLGTPRMLDGKSNTVRFLMVADDNHSWFGFKEIGMGNIKYCPSGYFFVSEHLRISPMGTKPVTQEIGWEQGRLNGDDQFAQTAFKKVAVFCLGSFEPGVLKYRNGEIAGTLDASTVGWYKEHAKGFNLGKVYEVEIDAGWLKVNDTMQTLSWMISIPKQYESLYHDEHTKELLKVKSYEAQDMILTRALNKQRVSREHAHIELQKAEEGLNWQSVKYATDAVTGRLWAWHPIIKKAKTLTLGHLSDVHVNVRQNAMAQSLLCVLEGGGETSDKAANPICNTSMAFYDLLVNQMKAKGADAVFLTGDMHDFNRNLNPMKHMESGLQNVKGQWSNFNVVTNLNNAELYQRGLDDCLTYSIILEAYKKDIAVFMTTGNHEAYSVPYGISPRIDNAVETTLAGDNLFGGSHSFKVGKAESVDEGSEKESFSTLGTFHDRMERAKTDKEMAKLYGEDAMEAMNEWRKGKANEGISADHNLTIYEATLIYGPTYAQIVSAKNFQHDRFDWFAYVFTPLKDWRFTHSGNQYVGLGWGNNERYLQVGNKIGEYSVNAGADQQGGGFLPRASMALDEHQMTVLTQAKKLSTSEFFVFSHFTMVNYNNPEPYNDKKDKGKRNKLTFAPRKDFRKDPGTFFEGSAGWNQANFGTVELNLQWYFNELVQPEGGSKTQTVTAHFSGHSHRAGVYAVKELALQGKNMQYEVTHAVDPGLPVAGENVATGSKSYTRFLVTSNCGQGTANINDEMGPWHVRPPSGLVWNAGEISQVKPAYKKHEGISKPRLCVGLDYMEVMGIEKTIEWRKTGIGVNPIDKMKVKMTVKGKQVEVERPIYAAGATVKTMLFLGDKTNALKCIEKVEILKFENGGWKAGKNAFTVDSSAGAGSCLFELDRLNPLAAAAATGGGGSKDDDAKTSKAPEDTVRWFCRASLKTPKIIGAEDLAVGAGAEWLFPISVKVETNYELTADPERHNASGWDAANSWTKSKLGALGGMVGWAKESVVGLAGKAAAAVTGARVLAIKRQERERGEVPDWDWLHTIDEDKYPKRREITKAPEPKTEQSN